MTVTVLEASQGGFLTQTTLKEGEERLFVTKAFLAQDGNISDWRSASEAEKQEYERINNREHGIIES